MGETDRIYDACVVGAGPAGSTFAHDLARRGREVLLLEKERFPRDKICGDAVCGPAHGHLRRMGVLGRLEAEEQTRWARIGGFVSPSGLAYEGDSTGDGDEPLVVAIRRKALDAAMVEAAVAAGARLVEEAPVSGASLSAADGAWTVTVGGPEPRAIRARLLVAADGASSRLARSLGVLRTPPGAVCSRAYVEPGTHRFEADGVVFYPRELLPGYCALFKEADGGVNYCCYIIPGGRCRASDLRRVHHSLAREDPHISAALGPDAVLEPMRSAPLRLGGVPRSYGERFLMVGDAAGQIDPLTGEGIHHAIEGGAIAAEVAAEGLDAGDLGRGFLRRYHVRWMEAFGGDFFWSSLMAAALRRSPEVLDACAVLSQRRGAEFMLTWARAMTGGAPKSAFLHPGVWGPIVAETARRYSARS